MNPMGIQSGRAAESINRHKRSFSEDYFTFNYMESDIENNKNR